MDGPAFMRALAVTKFDSPTGPVRLDRNRHAVVSANLSKVEVAANGRPVIRTIRTVRDVDQTYGGYFSPSTPTPTVSRPGCHGAEPPPWAR
jgi:hypothetical protein